MVGEASGRMQKADCRDGIALPAAMLAWLKCGKQRTRNSRVSVGLKSPFRGCGRFFGPSQPL